MKRFALGAAALAVTAAGSLASADVIITEIFYNLSGSEGGATEWIELHNTGNTAVDLTGWVYADTQDGQFSDPLPAGSSIAAGGTAIIVAQSAATFASIWGPGINVITYTGTLITLANGASATNETVAIFDAANNLIDDVNFENATNGWPDDNLFSSIYLLPSALSSSANDIGSNWANSAVGIDGAYEALILNPDISNASVRDVASPGLIPSPGALALLGVGGLVATRRHRA